MPSASNRNRARKTVDHELFWISGSPYSWRVQLALEYKGVPYVSRRLDTGKQEHRSPAFLALNPRGKAPVLKTGDAAICESVAIIASWTAFTPPFRCSAERRRITAVSGNACSSSRITRAIRSMWRSSDRCCVAMQRRMPRRCARPRVAYMMRSAAWIRHCRVRLNAITAADIVALPNIQLLRRVAARPEATEMALGLDELSARLPALGAWLGRIEAMRGYDTAYPPHWRSP
jgi:glutathione S-transferase